MKKLRIMAVGRIKTSFWQEAAELYHGRLLRTIAVEEVLVRDADARLPLPERLETEAGRLLKHRRASDTLICLDERGAMMTSEAFAAFLRKIQASGKVPCFAVGGAFGLAASFKQLADYQMALGPMTFPHELARVILLEQLYRAETILAGTGYHH